MEHFGHHKILSGIKPSLESRVQVYWAHREWISMVLASLDLGCETKKNLEIKIENVQLISVVLTSENLNDNKRLHLNIKLHINNKLHKKEQPLDVISVTHLSL